MTVVIDGATGITSSGGYSGDGISFADGTPSNTLVTTTGGHVGVGLTPNVWAGGNIALQMAGPSMWGASGVSHWSTNTYFDGSNYKYIATGTAHDYYQYNGAHVLRSSDSGTAGANVSTFANLISVAKGQTLALQGASSQTGTGISFPVDQNASSDARTLDDYEEGTWTPTIGGNATYTQQAGYYVKIGTFVFLKFALQINVKGTGSAQFITGLPFAVGGTASPRASGNAAYFSNLASAVTALTFAADGSGIYISATNGSTTGSIDAPSVIGNSTYLLGTLIYTTN